MNKSDGGRAQKQKKRGRGEEGGGDARRLPKYVNKQRLLLVASRGITARQRHLMEDVSKLLPQHKAENKLDCKGEPRALNEICEVKSCNGCLYFESRKRTRLYAWFGRPAAGPTVKFSVLNVHTMDELRLTGNCGLGTRPLLCFDRTFRSTPLWRLCEELLTATFAPPRGHPKTKPFHDHCLSFAIVEDAIWVRHFQITRDGDDDDDVRLIEIGPRFVLAPLRVLSGSFRGATVFSRATDDDDDDDDDGDRAAPRKTTAYQARVRAKAQRREYAAALASSVQE